MRALEIMELIDPINQLQLNSVNGIQVGSKTVALRSGVKDLLLF